MAIRALFPNQIRLMRRLNGTMPTHRSMLCALMMAATSSHLARPCAAHAAMDDTWSLRANEPASQSETWSLRALEPARIDEISRALWWKDSVGLSFGAHAVGDDDIASVGGVHLGGAWRLPIERGFNLTLRSELVGTRTSVDAWRSGATWSLELSPNAAFNASAWWTAPQDDTMGGSTALEGDGSVLLGFTLTF